MTLPHNGTDTSFAAAQSKVSSAEIDRERVFNYVVSRGEQGATCDEAEVALGMSHQSCSPRFNELAKNNLEVTELRRPTRSGRKARVYKVRAL